ncbi:dienelactone hydrolase family protein [Sphingobium sp.]|uniref:dienelactone hydrolase family protein n=1 Tax=Sphingobium sp. TaxID=1912891 RepID=UPI0028BDA814|nr:dienelactone hydrolase family protein [Sphingobium sp.]
MDETINYDADVPMQGTVYRPSGTRNAPAILVFPDIFGLGEHAHERAERLAGLGYVAMAADLHGSARLLDFPDAMAELDRFYAEPDLPLGRADAALACLRNIDGVDADRIAAVGFCYGGTLAFEMARRGAPLAASIGFHSGLTTNNPDGASRVTGKILACIGSEDPAIPAEQRTAFEAEMRAANVDWQLHVYGGVYHTFTDRRCDKVIGQPNFARYDAVADHRSWNAMSSLLREVFQAEI